MSDIRDRLEIAADDLVGHCQPEDLPFDTTDDLMPIEAIYGQERAVRSIDFALGMEDRGYNLYASGPDGIGKSTIVQQFLSRRAAQLPAPPDWIYVHNFADTDRPVGIGLPAGEGRIFAERTARTVQAASRELKQAFESDSYARQRGEFGQRMEQRRSALLEQLSADAKERGFHLQMSPQGVTSAPIVNDEVLNDEAFQALPEEQRTAIEESAHQLESVVQDAMLQMRGLERDAQDELNSLDEQVASFAIEHLFQPLLDQHEESEEIVTFLKSVRDDIRKERDRFRQPPAQQEQAAAAQLGRGNNQGPDLHRYAVNVVISNDPTDGAPLITERHPTYYNLLGRVEYAGQFGGMAFDHTLIKAGSLATASGGFLVLRLRDLIQNPIAYDGLKRALLTQEIAIENLSEVAGLVPTTAVRPEPMPLDVKVVIVGDAGLYGYLFRIDPDFRELFRVKADFEVDVERNAGNIIGLAALIRLQCERGDLLCFSRDAVARLVEHSSRVVQDQRRLSANMGAFTDLIRQANYWATQDGDAAVGPQHVDRALEEHDYRSSLVRDRLQQMIEDGSIFIDTEGAKVGQINALSVYDLGDITFGRPSRISCVTSAGRGSIVNVERESNMAGNIHNKGWMILRGYLTDTFGQDKALSLHASLTFEQLYGDIDGDSASSTEIYSLLSSLAEVPIDQQVAVTGSVNQRGEVQPIGGATAKIEGFYEVCRARGLNGKQGVMIPKTNVPTVTLRPEVEQAIAAGQFHVWAVETIEEGVEVLTGVTAGERAADGRFAEGTIYRKVEDRLDEFYHAITEHREAGGAETPSPVAPPVPPAVPPGIPPQPPEPPISV
ncbi:MAG TPA: ATP-binding protein [Dehalococcoidia bacterium]|nr:ATP-binding protein [Dehalococcoidia bacterium]